MKKEFETKTLDQITDKYIGRKGTAARDKFELDLEMDRIGEMIMTVRKQQDMTQEELGKLVGVQKAQISKIENNTKDVRLSTILKTLHALNARIKLVVELEHHSKPQLA